MNIRYLVLAAALVAACNRDSGTKDDSLARDLAMASQAQTPPPQFSDTANTGPKPQRMEAAPRTRPVQRPAQSGATPRREEAAAAVARTIGSGASFAMSSQQRVCTGSNRAGDRFVALLTQPVTGSNGAVIPSGSSVVLEVASASPDNNSMTFRAVAVEFNGMSYPVTGDVIPQSQLERTKIENSDPNADKKKVIGGAVLGAIAGRIIGKSTKGTVIGAATGAAAGAVAAKASEKYENCLPSGAQIRLTLANQIIL